MTERGASIATFDEFIEAAAVHFGYASGAGSPFPSREDGVDALRRWWGERVALEVVAPGSYRWRCPGCAATVTVQGDDVHTWELFDHVLWEQCPTCSALLRGEEED